MNYWIKIDKSKKMPMESPILLMDEYGNVYIGSTGRTSVGFGLSRNGTETHAKENP